MVQARLLLCLALTFTALASQVGGKPVPPLPHATNRFGNALYSAVLAKGKPSEEGLVLSPFSILQAMSMLINGADPASKSYRQLQSTVYRRTRWSVDDLNSNMLFFVDKLLEVPASSNISISNANSVWVKEDFTLQQGFKQTMQQFYAAQVEPLTTAEVVNSWVSNATSGKISNIVNDGALRDAALVLVNALYLKAPWKDPFDKKDTAPASFKQLSGSVMSVAMMTTDTASAAQVAVFEGRRRDPAKVPCVAVKVPYKGGSYSAILAMPTGSLNTQSGGQLRLASPDLTYEKARSACRAQLLAGLAGSSSVEFVEPFNGLRLSFPRFEIEYGTSLKAPLKKMGVTAPFKAGDFTGMTDRPLKVNDIIHKVFMKVNEDGIEAAAATGVIMGPTSMPMPDESITFDRPFTMMVVHEETRTALFVGEVNTPEAWSDA